LKWIRLAADQGNANAQYNLGVMYFQGIGVSKDVDEGVKWWRRAAAQGDAEAKHNLAVVARAGGGKMKLLRKLFGGASYPTTVAQGAPKASETNMEIIVCPKCGVRHVLAQTSFLLSPQQALSLLSQDVMVLRVGDPPAEYMVGELDAFPQSAKLELKRLTLQSIFEAARRLSKCYTATWICRNCGTGGNSFPSSWAYDSTLREASTRLKLGLLSDIKKFWGL
jgi:TPR repeat protein